MERPSRLAELTLVTKYYPVANYSYPRQDGVPTPNNSRRSSNTSNNDRSSVGSEGSTSSSASSPPGLVDDRTDSEASGDDDYQYHTVANELWDSFWKPGHDGKKPIATPPTSSTRQFPALIPSPQNARRRPHGPRTQGSEAWPLPNHQTGGHRKPSPTYSPFPKPTAIPPRSCSRQGSRSPCCENGFLAPPSQHLPNLIVPQQTPSRNQPRSPRPRDVSPVSPRHLQRPATSHGSRPTSPMDRPSPVSSPQLPMSGPTCPRESRSTTDLHLSSPNSLSRPETSRPQTLRLHKSAVQLRPQKALEPQSVFEDDSDSECDAPRASSAASSPTLAFFRFHKRGGEGEPNNRRRGSAAKIAPQSYIEAATAAKHRRQQRKRNSTAFPSSPILQGDVISRVLCRRGR